MVITTFENYVVRNGMDVAGDAFSLGFTALIFLIAVGLVVYSRTMHKLNVIR
jgi:high-affinity Fe2+/Pb2+ permease